MLIRENNEQADRTWVYTYPKDGDDQATSGNILSRKTYEYTTAATPANLISTDTFTYGNSAWGDLLTGCGNKTITYSGTRPVTYGDYSLSWYRGGLLSGFSKSGDTNTYTYDVSGRRLSKSHNGTTTTFIYAGDLLLGQKTGSNKLTFLFDSAGNYFGFDYNGTKYYYVKNLQGDVTAITNASAQVVVTYYYDAWGRALSGTDTSGVNIGTINPIRYRGYYYDTETGFYFLQSRYYDPEICRFLTIDDPDVLSASPMDLTDKHLFSYCDNNPVLRKDDGGDCWHIIAGAIIGGITSFVPGLVATIKDDEPLSHAFISMAFGAASGALCAAVPTAALAIDAAFSAAESITLGVLKHDDAATIAVDTLLSVGFSVVTSGKGEVLNKKSTYETIESGVKAVKSAYRPAIRKAAKKQLSKTFKKIGKRVAKNQLEGAAYKAIDYGTRWFLEKAYGLDLT